MLRIRTLAAVVTLALFAALAPGIAHAAAGDVGSEGPSWSGATTDPSGSKPESKLWWNDGKWWGSLFDTTSRDFHIFRLDIGASTQTWVDTGVALDDRPNSRADVLWDGTKLYVASHIFVNNTSAPATSATEYSRLYRYSYNTTTNTYSPDAGFPVEINRYKSETLVIDKDSTGQLWATWTQASDLHIWVNRSLNNNDQTWGTPFVPQVSGTSINKDDISSLIRFGGNNIGLMWSNQTASAMYFAVHVDGQPDTTWEASRTALQGPKNADDHINLKSLQADAGGRVFAAVKTSHSTSASPLVMLLVRDPSNGDWASHVYGRVSENHTRPIVLLDADADVIHMFASGPAAAGGSNSEVVYEKTTPLTSISFSQGYGTPVIKDADVLDMDDATSTKQNVNATTGIVVLASNSNTKRYWHHYSPLGTPPPPGSPVAAFSATPTSGPAPLTVNFTDTSTGAPTSWSWNFGHGDTSNLQNPTHTYPAGGPYTVSLTVTGSGTDTETKQSFITIADQAASVTFNPVADAYVKSDKASSNFGTTRNLRVRSTGPTITSYLKFDVGGLSGSVGSAKLRLRVADTSTNGGNVYVAGNGWTETGITWANAPARDGSPVATILPVPTTKSTWLEADVTSAVTGNGTVSLAIADGATNAVYYDSRESANAPQLVVSAAAGPGTPPPDTAGFTATPTSGTAPLTVGFTDTSTGSPTSWAWTFGDGGTSTDQSPRHTYLLAGTYTATLTATYPTTTDTATQVINVQASGGASTSTSFNPVADAYVRSDSTTSNFGTTKNLRVRSAGPTIVSYLKFDVSGLSGTVGSAKLRLWVADVSTDGGNVHTVADNSWTETGITWANAPSPALSSVATIGATVATAGTWVEVDVTSAVTGNGTWTLALAGGASNPVFYDSREAAHAPELVIVTPGAP